MMPLGLGEFEYMMHGKKLCQLILVTRRYLFHTEPCVTSSTIKRWSQINDVPYEALNNLDWDDGQWEWSVGMVFFFGGIFKNHPTNDYWLSSYFEIIINTGYTQQG